jgi:hypothetical protein
MSDHMPAIFATNDLTLIAASKSTTGYTLGKNLFHVIFQVVEDALLR